MFQRMLILLLFLVISQYSCKSPTNANSKYQPPSDHTISKEGAMHKQGLTDPLQNCVACHGNDLKGGTVGVSCFECHGKKW